MVLLAMNRIKEYIAGNLPGALGEKRSVYQEIDRWLEQNPGRISIAKFERYLNGEIDWLIDCARCERRGTGRIRDSTKRVVYDSRQVLYCILKDFDLSRIRNLQ